MKIYAIGIVVILVSCSTTVSNETSDSTEFSIDSMDLANASVLIDTTYIETLAPSSFTSPQLDEKVAYVFSPGGLDVYETADGQNVVGNVEWRAKVFLALPLVNNTSTDTMTADGLKGHFAEITYKGKSGYVFSGYLVGMPVPDAGSPIIEYFRKNLHLAKPATRTTHECDCDMMSSESKYEFENGIVITESSGYESYDNSVAFKNKMSLQEVYLLASHFYSRLSEHAAEFPQSASTEEREGGVTVTINASGAHITEVVVSTGEGCYEEEGVHEADNHILMSANGGC